VNAANWTVPDNHPAFAGHFPGRPIVPGVVLLDRAIQAIGQSLGGAAAPCSIANAKFLSPVGPGATLEFSWEVATNRSIRFAIARDGMAVASGTLTLAEPQ
jgi:3-hydroxymyristoyl/3-hydroxydecanoyl-(acyl carrier protein) dehydratase